MGSLRTQSQEDFEALVRGRRTNLRIDPDRPVPREVVEWLCTLAMWAPNHKRTWPWRFAALTGGARARLGEVLAADLARNGSDEHKIVKAREKYLRAPLLLAVACAADATGQPVRHAEDRDAVAAGVQNILLGCTAVGLASYWGTGAVTELPEVKQLCGFGAEDTVVALVYVGWPAGDVPVPERPTTRIHYAG